MILDAAQEQRPPILQKSRAGIEHGINWVRPIGGRQERVLDMPLEKPGLRVGRWRHSQNIVFGGRVTARCRVVILRLKPFVLREVFVRGSAFIG